MVGTLVINQTEQCVETLDIQCEVEASSKTKRTARNREMEIDQATKGSFGVRLSCAKK